MSTFFAAAAFLPSLLGAVPFGFLAIYIVLRWRERDDPVRDPQVGAKCALLLFRQLALLVALSGATAIFAHLFESLTGRHSDADTLWTGVALLLSNALVWFAAGRALARTNESTFRRATRMFLGLTAVLSGVVAIAALSATSVALFTGESGTQATLSWAGTIVWVPAAALLVGAVLRRSPKRVGEDVPRPEAGQTT